MSNKRGQVMAKVPVGGPFLSLSHIKTLQQPKADFDVAQLGEFDSR
jgi:hypothetical protein